MSIVYSFAIPTDPDLDAFNSGEAEVDAYFQNRQWFNADKNKASPPTYRFELQQTGELVGYAALAFANQPLEDKPDSARAKFLVVYAVGVTARWQGVAVSGGKNAASTILEIVDAMSQSKPGCVGMYLRVRSNNARALRFYEKVGFTPDPGGAVQHAAQGAPHLSMRKLI